MQCSLSIWFPVEPFLWLKLHEFLCVNVYIGNHGKAVLNKVMLCFSNAYGITGKYVVLLALKIDLSNITYSLYNICGN